MNSLGIQPTGLVNGVMGGNGLGHKSGGGSTSIYQIKSLKEIFLDIVNEYESQPNNRLTHSLTKQSQSHRNNQSDSKSRKDSLRKKE